MSSSENKTITEDEMAKLLVDVLQLEISAEEIGHDDILFGPKSKLHFDSVDALEIAYGIAKEYDVQLQSENKNNEEIFRNITNLTKFVNEQRAE